MGGPPGVPPRGLDVVSPSEVWVAGYSGSAAAVSQWRNETWTTRYTQASTGRHLTVFEAIAGDGRQALEERALDDQVHPGQHGPSPHGVRGHRGRRLRPGLGGRLGP